MSRVFTLRPANPIRLLSTMFYRWQKQHQAFWKAATALALFNYWAAVTAWTGQGGLSLSLPLCLSLIYCLLRAASLSLSGHCLLRLELGKLTIAFACCLSHCCCLFFVEYCLLQIAYSLCLSAWILLVADCCSLTMNPNESDGYKDKLERWDMGVLSSTIY